MLGRLLCIDGDEDSGSDSTSSSSSSSGTGTGEPSRGSRHSRNSGSRNGYSRLRQEEKPVEKKERPPKLQRQVSFKPDDQVPTSRRLPFQRLNTTPPSFGFGQRRDTIREAANDTKTTSSGGRSSLRTDSAGRVVAENFEKDQDDLDPYGLHACQTEDISSSYVVQFRNQTFFEDNHTEYFIEEVNKKAKRYPYWVKNKKTLDLMQRFRSGKLPVPLGLACGPAARVAKYFTLFLFFYLLLLMPLLRGHARCTEANPVAFLPSWVPMAASVPVWIVALYCQHEYCRYILIPRMQVVDVFTLVLPLLKVKISPALWFVQVMMMSFSIIYHCVYVSVFTAVMQASTECPKNEVAEEVWRQVMRQSILAFILSGDQADDVDLATISLVSWGVMLMSLVFTLLIAVPVPCQDERISYEVCRSQAPPSAGACVCCPQYHTLETLLVPQVAAGNKVMKCNHGCAMSRMAEATGLCSFVLKDLDFTIKKANIQWREAKDGYVEGCAFHARTQCMRMLLHLLFLGGIRSPLQLNLQLSVISMRKRLLSESLNSFEMAWLGIGIVCSMFFVLDLAKVLRLCHSIWSKIRTLKDKDVDGSFKMVKCSLLRVSLWLAFLSFVFTWGVVYTVLKFYWVCWGCDSGFWNLFTGCAEVEIEVEAPKVSKP